MITVPFSYSRLFPHKKEDTIEQFLEEIPSKIVLIVLSYINHHLHVHTPDEKIFDFVSRNWPKEVKDGIILSCEVSSRKYESPCSFFDKWTICELIKYELVNYRDFEYAKADTTPLDEYKIFMAYLISVDNTLSSHDERLPKNQEENLLDDFQKNTWPIIVQQFEFTQKLNPLFEALKSNLLLNSLAADSNIEPYVTTYLTQYGFNNSWDYISGYINLINPSIASNNTNGFPIITLPLNHPYQGIIDANIIDVSEYQSNERLQLRYNGIRQKPILKYSDNSYLVLDWNFLYSQIGIGLLFDFYYKSGIKAVYHNLSDFKAHVGKHVSEEKIFRGLLRFLYTKKYSELHLEEDDKYPDAYLREGKSLYLFEFKDILFPDKAIDIADFEALKAIIENKLIRNKKGRPKGISQLINHINYLSTDTYEFDHFSDRQIKRRNMEVFPIIVYSHNQFSLPGVNDYLIKRFNELKEESTFKKVHPPIMISIDYILKNLKILKSKKLKDVIKGYHKKTSNLRKKFKKGDNFHLFSLQYASVEDIDFSASLGSLAQLSKEEKAAFFDMMEVH